VILNVIGRPVRIGQDLPHGQRCCVELQASVAETAMYINVPEQAAGTLSKSHNEKKETNVRNMADHRRLCHAAATTTSIL